MNMGATSMLDFPPFSIRAADVTWEHRLPRPSLALQRNTKPHG